MTRTIKLLGAIFLLFSSISHSNAQKGLKIIGNYYYLDFPRADIFNTAFSIPNGKNDPSSVPSTSDEIINDDLEVSIGAAKQTKNSITNRNNNFLLNSWSHVKGISVSTEFYKVKHTQVKNLSWSKYKDEAYHVIEALSGDSVLIKIYKNKGDTVGSAMLQNIANLFVGKNTVVGKVLTLLGSTDSTSKSQKDIVKLKSSSKDTVTLMLNDNKVYFAVRYAKISEPKTSKAWNLLQGRRDEAPYCGPKVQKNPPEIVEFTLGEKQKTFSLIGTNCSINNYIVKANFVNDFTDGGTVYITKEYRGSVAQNTKKDVSKIDTVFISESINFSDEYFNRNYNDSRPFVANEIAKSSGSKNILVVCDIEFSYDPSSRKIKVVNYPKADKYYHTCVYQMSASISFFPN